MGQELRADQMHKEDQVYMEAYDQSLECWTTLLTNTDKFPAGFFKSHAAQVFNCYLQCHLVAPDGTRNKREDGQETDEDDEDDINEVEEDDRDLFAEQLINVGALGRAIPEHSIPLLTKLLEDRVTKLGSHLHHCQQHIQQAEASGGIHNIDYGTKELHQLFEDLHWLILIAGYVLADESRGETPQIPLELIQYSMQESQNVDIDTSLRLLVSPDTPASSLPGVAKTDQIIRLISSVLRLANIESQAVSANLAVILSPQVGRTISWFLRRWLLSYLLLNEKYYAQMSLPFSSAFAQGSESAQWIAGFLVDKVSSNLSVWSSEHELAADTVNLLVALIEKKERCLPVIKCNSFWLLAKQHATDSPPLNLLPADIKCNVMRALVMAGSSAPTDTKQRYWKEILLPVQEQFKQLLQQEDFVRKAQDEDVKQRISVLLSLLKGVVMGTRVDNVSELFAFCVPLLNEGVPLLRTYQNCPEMVEMLLAVFVEVASRQLCYLSKADSNKLYEASIGLLQTYSQCNLGKKRQDVTAEEDQYEDLSALMELLTHLLSKDMVDFLFSESGGVVLCGDVDAADITLHGLNIVIPLMNAQLLQFPNLCKQYFKLITFICDMYPEKLNKLSDALFQSLMGSLEMGLADYGTEVTKMCLDAIASMAEDCHKGRQRDSLLYRAMEHFIQVVFNFVLLQSFDMDLTNPASEAFYCLICCHQAKYTELVNMVLSNQSDPSYHKRLTEAFSQLTPPEEALVLDRTHKVQFLHRLENFLLNVRAFLCVK